MLPFIDLNKQYRRIESDVDAAIKRVLEHGKFILGPEVAQLEKELAEFTGSKYCLGCSSGTDALMMALMAFGIGPGDAVFTTPFTFFATVEVISLLGATPVFADIESDTYNLDANKLREAIHKVKKEGKLKPKAIIPVDLFGLCADYKAIISVADEFEIPVIQDACQAFGAVQNGKRAPIFGAIGCTSFFPAKPLGCYGDGGAVFTDDKELFDIMFSILVHGRGSDKYDNVRLGLNARLDTIQAAVLLEKLKIYPEEIELRRKVASLYMEKLDGLVKIPVIPANNTSVWAQFCVMSPKFTEIQAELAKNDIPTARYYPIPMHLLKAMEYLGYKKGDFPITEASADTIFALPMHPYLAEESIEKIVSVIRSTVS